MNIFTGIRLKFGKFCNARFFRSWIPSSDLRSQSHAGHLGGVVPENDTKKILGKYYD